MQDYTQTYTTVVSDPHQSNGGSLTKLSNIFFQIWKITNNDQANFPGLLLLREYVQLYIYFLTQEYHITFSPKIINMILTTNYKGWNANKLMCVEARPNPGTNRWAGIAFLSICHI